MYARRPPRDAQPGRAAVYADTSNIIKYNMGGDNRSIPTLALKACNTTSEETIPKNFAINLVLELIEFRRFILNHHEYKTNWLPVAGFILMVATRNDVAFNDTDGNADSRIGPGPTRTAIPVPFFPVLLPVYVQDPASLVFPSAISIWFRF
ncbi:hypothetical protein EVAR_76413_1 [Eumeta japonica]|uniref:Uncharacterized protein n=1 Tax=Eumeta variegata TaxID=151549 RepID=A0A4C1T838_EUMVA|nr:hypothetical protein EVAR_76413_1 [Eumeta japonica]